MAKFGKYTPDGAVESEATECILTGTAIARPFDNTIRERVSGTPYFYRILGSQYHQVTDSLRDQWRVEARVAIPAPEMASITRSGRGKKDEGAE